MLLINQKIGKFDSHWTPFASSFIIIHMSSQFWRNCILRAGVEDSTSYYMYGLINDICKTPVPKTAKQMDTLRYTQKLEGFANISDILVFQ